MNFKLKSPNSTTEGGLTSHTFKTQHSSESVLTDWPLSHQTIWMKTYIREIYLTSNLTSILKPNNRLIELYLKNQNLKTFSYFCWKTISFQSIKYWKSYLKRLLIKLIHLKTSSPLSFGNHRHFEHRIHSTHQKLKWIQKNKVKKNSFIKN